VSGNPAIVIVNPIHAREGEVVDIHWHTKQGDIFVQRVRCPTREAPSKEEP
jgi:hypothetical protein